MAGGERRRCCMDMFRDCLLILGRQHPVVGCGNEPRWFCRPGRDRHLLGQACRIPCTLNCIDVGSFGWPKIGDEVLVDSFAGERKETRGMRLCFAKTAWTGTAFFTGCEGAC